MADFASGVAIAAGIAALASAVASSLSARNSGRSASAAEKSADASVKALHRAAVRELVALCHEVLLDESRIHSLANDLAPELTALFNLSSTFGGSAHTSATQHLEKDVNRAAERAAEARRTSERWELLYEKSTIEVNQTVARVIVARDELRVIRESMERHLNYVRGQNAEIRKQGTH